MGEYGHIWEGIAEGVSASVRELKRQAEELEEENEELQEIVETERTKEEEQIEDLRALRTHCEEMCRENEHLRGEKARLQGEIELAKDLYQTATDTVETDESALKAELLVWQHKQSQLQQISRNLASAHSAAVFSLKSEIRAAESRRYEKSAMLTALRSTLAAEQAAFAKELRQVQAQSAALAEYLNRL